MKIAVFSILAFCVGLWTGILLNRKRMRLMQLQNKATHEVADLLGCKGALEEMRKGATSNVTEHLEFCTDILICSLWRKVAKLDGSRRDFIIQVLKQVREYRKSWPRSAKGFDLVGGDSCFEEAQSTAADARKVLDGL